MRTCSVKRPCIDRIYNVRVVFRVQPTPQRGKGMGKERGSQEGENLRDRDRAEHLPLASAQSFRFASLRQSSGALAERTSLV